MPQIIKVMDRDILSLFSVNRTFRTECASGWYLEEGLEGIRKEILRKSGIFKVIF